MCVSSEYKLLPDTKIEFCLIGYDVVAVYIVCYNRMPPAKSFLYFHPSCIQRKHIW